MNSTRMYHRNSALAFPKTADYACAIERKRPADRTVNWTLFVAAIAIIASLVWQAQP